MVRRKAEKLRGWRVVATFSLTSFARTPANFWTTRREGHTREQATGKSTHKDDERCLENERIEHRVGSERRSTRREAPSTAFACPKTSRHREHQNPSWRWRSLHFYEFFLLALLHTLTRLYILNYYSSIHVAFSFRSSRTAFSWNFVVTIYTKSIFEFRFYKEIKGIRVCMQRNQLWAYLSSYEFFFSGFVLLLEQCNQK